jgi:phosphoglycerate kinase
VLLDGIKTIDSFDARGKKILLRLDLNSPVDRKSGKIQDSSKIAASAGTLRELLSENAAVAILAHQGRPGEYDFISMEEHYRIMKGMIGSAVSYVPDVCAASALSEIEKLRPGKALLLDNVRKLDYEQKNASASDHAGRELVTALSPRFDYFVNDAFAAIHRAHCSMVGFTKTLPSAIGRLMEAELTGTSRLLDNPSKPVAYVFGGKKFSDFIPVLESVCSDSAVETVLLSGYLAIVFLMSSGIRVDSATGQKIASEEDSRLMERASKLLQESGKVHLPSDMAFDRGGSRVEKSIHRWPEDLNALDIGSKTIRDYTSILSAARTVFISGPAGVYERRGFDTGTTALFGAAAVSDKFSLAGGGHTSAAAKLLGFAGRFSYISTGGGALEALISRKRLPVLDYLKESAITFSSSFKQQENNI